MPRDAQSDFEAQERCIELQVERIRDLEREVSAVRAERDRGQLSCQYMGRRIVELRDALGKAIDYCDAATHDDGQYADERSALLRAWRGDDQGQ